MSPSDRSYPFRYLVGATTRVDDAQAWRRLLALIEERDFFGRQAECTGSFRRSMDDIERHLLPRLIDEGDWLRLLCFSQIAANLRGLAETLDAEPILEALVAAGRTALAGDMVSQLSDPLRRARAWSVLAGAYGRGEAGFGRLLDAVARDVEESREPEDRAGAEARCRALETVARRLAVELSGRWPGWSDGLGAFGQDLSDRVWCAVVDGWLERGKFEASGLWEALRAVRDRDRLLSRLLVRVADLEAVEPERWFRLFEAGLPGVERSWLWRLVVGLLARSGRPGPELLERWGKVRREFAPVPWSLPLIDAGSGLWSRLPEPELDELDRSISCPAIGAALRVAALEGRPSPGEELVEAALRALDAMSPGSEQLHWVLRFLAVRLRTSATEVRQVVAAVARYLARVRFAVDDGDLRRFLDLVAEVSPSDLERQVERVFWAPGRGCATLRALARGAVSPVLQRHLFDRAEELAALVAKNGAEGFELRREVVVVLARKLSTGPDGEEIGWAAVDKLLPEEEDRLRIELARGLAEAGRGKEAQAVAAGLVSGRSRLLTLLEVLPPGADRDALLSPQRLYAAVADGSALEDERRALTAVDLPPDRILDLTECYLRGIGDPARRIDARMDLAHRALDEEQRGDLLERHYRDRALAMLAGSLGVAESDLWLARLTPGLVAIGTRVGASAGVAELQEAIERVAGLETVSWEQREEILLDLMASLPGLVSSGVSRRRARKLLSWIESLPERFSGRRSAELREGWRRIAPWLAAMAVRIGEGQRWAGPAPAGPDSETVRTLAIHASVENPDEVPGLVASLPPGAERDRLALRLLTWGGLARETEERLLELLPADGRSRSLGELVCGLGPRAGAFGEDRWLEAISRLTSDAAIDPGDPRTAPVRRRLREVAPRLALPALARAIPGALARDGRHGGEVALRFFLDAYLAPGRGRGRARSWRVAKAGRASLRLGRLRPTR